MLQLLAAIKSGLRHVVVHKNAQRGQRSRGGEWGPPMRLTHNQANMRDICIWNWIKFNSSLLRFSSLSDSPFSVLRSPFYILHFSQKQLQTRFKILINRSDARVQEKFSVSLLFLFFFAFSKELRSHFEVGQKLRQAVVAAADAWQRHRGLKGQGGAQKGQMVIRNHKARHGGDTRTAQRRSKECAGKTFVKTAREWGRGAGPT